MATERVASSSAAERAVSTGYDTFMMRQLRIAGFPHLPHIHAIPWCHF
ncbi:hypothetical protein N177_1359 [Lutibaculum baratangense AMV1]|uniref:Uncharacterized protein n=1 Tax=Lutibaculum baratangense AMV1 TaxID=631454 RepID=V4RL45_9HYPH|nr:hypothetical protein N177_1359 [Lutibaculum baratangense AMV1]